MYGIKANRHTFYGIENGSITMHLAPVRTRYETLINNLEDIRLHHGNYYAFRADGTKYQVNRKTRQGSVIGVQDPYYWTNQGKRFLYDVLPQEDLVLHKTGLTLPQDSRLGLMCYKVDICRLEDLVDQDAYDAGVHPICTGVYGFPGSTITQPSPVAALVNWFCHERRLEAKNWFIWKIHFYTFRKRYLYGTNSIYYPEHGTNKVNMWVC